MHQRAYTAVCVSQTSADLFLLPALWFLWYCTQCYLQNLVADVEPDVVFCPSSQSFNMLCILRCTSLQYCCNEWLFDLFPSCQLKSVWPFSTELFQGIFNQGIVFAPFCINSRECCVSKISYTTTAISMPWSKSPWSLEQTTKFLALLLPFQNELLPCTTTSSLWDVLLS